ncbi:MAG: shikimate kinase AroK [Gammaproteobacteria bacterium]|nr:shikimate kinase AroK [Gammaproteobacteria bacterium]MCP5200751.1 shikimate kinase AroK [Gammaproteobacteria bacterium]
MSETARIFLIGPMGTGKTTIGNQLARSLGYSFVDADQEIEARTGASIALIFDVEGEAGFRERERRIIDELTQREAIVLATGGGAVLAADNREHLAARGFVVYLRTGIEALLRRMRFDTTRPLLRTEDPEGTLKRIIEEREPLYTSIADLIVDTGKLSVRQVVRRIAAELP